ncbi:MAG TPA: ABC transporter substrate-binding protein [bacterium]|nr:ABC transporter substrate-binding protein [bacterium]
MRKAITIIAAVLLLGFSVLPHDAMGAPAGSVFQGAWPYQAPPAGHYNSFIPGYLIPFVNPYNDLVEMPLAFYLWQKNEYIPVLAAQWKAEAGGRAFTVSLRPGVRWSDGSAFTSADVASTFYIGYLFGFLAWRSISGIETPNDQTVVFRFTTPASIALRTILRVNIRPRSVYGALADRAKPYAEQRMALTDEPVRTLTDEVRRFRPRESVATGPFRIDASSITEAQLTLVKNPTSFSANQVQFDRIVLFNGETPQITPLALSKQIDYATHAFPPATDRQFQELGVRVLRAPVYSGPALFFNHRISPLNRKEVRQAIAYAVNRDQSGTVALGASGRGVKVLTGFSDNLADNWLTADVKSKLNSYRYDPPRAAQILTRAGFKKGTDGVWVSDKGERMEYELSVPPEFADWSAAAEEVAAQLTRFGIRTTVRGVPNPQHILNVNEGRFQIALRTWGAGNPHPFFAFSQDLFIHNYVVNAVTRGMDFSLRQKTDAMGEVDLASMVDSSGAGTNLARQKSAVSRLALAFNELLPIIPLFERYSNSPVAEGLRVTGWPRDDDPIYKNHLGTDSFVTIMIFNGTLRPAGR